MAIVPRTLKDRKTIIYYVVTRGHAERVGPDKRAAERLDAKRKKEVKAGTYSPTLNKSITVGKYLAAWLEARPERSARIERSYLENHVLTREWFCSIRVDDMAPKFTQKLVEEIRDQSGLTHKTVENVYSVLRSAFRAAERSDLLTRNVCLLHPKTLTAKSKQRAPYTVAEVRRLLASSNGYRRVWIALAAYTGMRCGEVCGRRWEDWDADPEPLGALAIATQYDGLPLKTDTPRVAPVLPELAAILTEWKATGFELYFKRRPKPTDFIVPRFTRPGNGPTECLTMGGAYWAWARDCKAAGVPNKTQHAMRHTFVTLLRRGEADVSVVQEITHKPKGKIVDIYTHRDWSELCKAALCLPSFEPQDPGSGPSKTGVDALLASQSSQIKLPDVVRADTNVRVNKAKTANETSFKAQQAPRDSSEIANLDAEPEARQESSDLQGANQARLARLAVIAEADPELAAPGLAACRALQAAYQGDQPTVESELSAMAEALGYSVGSKAVQS